jgi:hypothetical protein
VGWLELNPSHPLLRSHGLTGGLEGLQSMPILLKPSLTIEMILTNSEIVLIHVGDLDAVNGLEYFVTPCSACRVGKRADHGTTSSMLGITAQSLVN